jgi:hypothetical protein
LGLGAVALAAHVGCSDDEGGANGSGAAAGAGGGTTDCPSLEQAACDDDSNCTWIAAGCHGVTLFEDCFDKDMIPSPPPCAPQPCPDYATEPECTAQDACHWWPLDCPGHTITDQCLNIGFGDPESQCR